ncbi:SusC/RagA family TonB-linked outer membrane protein [Puteibacter caeruleilacunae]|nr:SusC/RagA family TonB-linked outer membrane protein [Puteibacter caeruleilacunae]
MMLLKKIFSGITFLVFIMSVAMAQDATVIRGVVTDKATGETLIGLTVAEVNENNRILGGTITDFEGRFVLGVKSDSHRLMFSFVGYKTKTVDINGKNIINIEIEEDVQAIEGIDIVARKIERHDDGFMNITKEEKTTASAVLNLEEVDAIPAASLGEAIQGRMAGVDITASSGDPGAGLSIQIRGNTSLLGGNVDPLIILNGLPYTSPGMDDFDFSTTDISDYSSLIDIAVEDIESIEIKKDAASAAVYGSEAQNGIIFITTKRGSLGKAKVDYSGKYSIKDQPASIPLLNGDQYSTMQLEARFNANNNMGTSVPVELSYDPEYKWFHEYSKNTDWLEAVTQTGNSQSHNVSVSGGGDQSLYRASVGYYNEKGTTMGTALQRISTSLNLDYHISDKTLLSSDFSYTHSEQEKNHDKDLRSLAYRKAPNMAIYVCDSLGNPTDVYFSPENNYQGSGTSYYNPVAAVNEAYSKVFSERLRSTLKLRVSPSKNFQVLSYVVLDLNSKQTRTWLPQVVTGAKYLSSSSNKVSHNDGKSFNVRHRTNFSFGKSFDATSMADFLGADPEQATQTLKFTFSYDLSNTNSISQKGSGSNTASTELQNYYSKTRISGFDNSTSDYRSLAFLGTFHYDLFKKYLISGTIREDASSKVSPDSRWKLFYATSIGWNFEKEGFLRSWDWLDFGKLRYSYGLNGGIPNAAYYGTYTTTDEYIDLKGLAPTKLQLDDLTYELTNQHDVGLELGIANKFNLEIDYYHKKTKNKVIKNYTIPSSTGFTTLNYGNFGTITNEGLEISGSYRVIDKKDLKWTVNFNVSKNQNVIVDLPENYSLESGNPLSNGSYLRKMELNKPTGSFFGYKYKGVYSRDEDNYLTDKNGNVVYNQDGSIRRLSFKEPDYYIFKGGDAIYEDLNNDGVINEYDVTYLGDSNSELYGGFGTNFKYKGFFMNANFQFDYGKEIVNGAKMNLEKMYTKDNQALSVINRWRKPGDVTMIPRALYQKGYNYLASDRFVEDGSYLRFKTLTLGYIFDKNLLRKVNLRFAKIYCTFYNLYTWTNYTGQDPEVGNSKSAEWYTFGIDNAKTPPAQNITLGINIGI